MRERFNLNNIPFLAYTGALFRVGVAFTLLWAQSTAALTSPSLPNPSLILALKFVEFTQKDGSPMIDQNRAQTLVQSLNSIYRSCQIQFQLEKYSKVSPSDYGLPTSPGSVNDMHRFRKPFDDQRYLVVIHTANWEHARLGPANAWTAMPGETPSGVVIEGKVGTFAGIVAHELGHYLNLDHVSDDFNVMNSVIYQRSNHFSSTQCSEIRTTANKMRSGAIRQYVGGKPTDNLRAAYSG